MKAVRSFSGAFDFLSNFYPSPIKIMGVDFPTVEHAYQASKMGHLNDYWRIGKAKTPGIAKRLGNKLPMRDDWERIKVTEMEAALRQKFAIPELLEKLLATGDAHLEEGNNWGDRFWGTVNGEGENHLGIILMEIRQQLQEMGHEN